MSGTLVEYLEWIGLILLAAIMGYIAGVRRRPSGTAACSYAPRVTRR
jgi:hypothetical protein